MWRGPHQCSHCSSVSAALDDHHKSAAGIQKICTIRPGNHILATHHQLNKIEDCILNISLDQPSVFTLHRIQGLYSLSGKTSYRNISWNLKAAKFRFRLSRLLWNLIGTFAAVLLRCLSNFRVICYYNIQSHSFEISRDLAVRRLTA